MEPNELELALALAQIEEDRSNEMMAIYFADQLDRVFDACFPGPVPPPSGAAPVWSHESWWEGRMAA